MVNFAAITVAICTAINEAITSVISAAINEAICAAITAVIGAAISKVTFDTNLLASIGAIMEVYA